MAKHSQPTSGENHHLIWLSAGLFYLVMHSGWLEATNCCLVTRQLHPSKTWSWEDGTGCKPQRAHRAKRLGHKAGWGKRWSWAQKGKQQRWRRYVGARSYRIHVSDAVTKPLMGCKKCDWHNVPVSRTLFGFFLAMVRQCTVHAVVQGADPV